MNDVQRNLSDDKSPELTQRLRLEKLSAQFEKDWKAGHDPMIEHLLDQEMRSNQSYLLYELLRIENHYRKSNKPLTEEECTSRFPAWLHHVVADFFAARITDNTTQPLPIDRFDLHMSSTPKNNSDFQIIHEIGRGGMGVVYRALDVELDRVVALKVGHSSSLEMHRNFVREACLQGRLSHGGIPAVHELGVFDDGRPFIALKLIEGETLAVKLNPQSPTHDAESVTFDETGSSKERDFRFSPYEFVQFQVPQDWIEIFKGVCEAVAFAHGQGIIHRDLKPANIMVGNFGQVTVMDWGLAKELKADSSREWTDQWLECVPTHGSVKADHGIAESKSSGTLGWMSPEQARHESDKVDRRSDVFNLGGILCLLLTGRVPFQAATEAELLLLMQKGDVRAAFDALDKCEAESAPIDLCKKCLSPEKAGRPVDANVVLEAIVTYQESLESRMQQAKLAEAAATIQAKAEKKQRQVEQKRANEESRRRKAEEGKKRLTLGLAGVLIMLVLGLASGAIWYFHHQSWLAQQQLTRRAQEEKDFAVFLQEMVSARKQAEVLTEDLAGQAKALKMASNSRHRLQRLLARTNSKVPTSSGRQFQEERNKLRQAEKDHEFLVAFDNYQNDRAKVDVKESRFRIQEALTVLFRAFNRFGLNPDVQTPQEAGTIIKTRPQAVQTKIQDILDVCFAELPSTQERQRNWLFDLLNNLDQDQLRHRIRKAMVKRKPKTLEKLVKHLDVRSHSPMFLVALANYLPLGQHSVRIDLLKRSQKRYPKNFWVAHNLAHSLITSFRHKLRYCKPNENERQAALEAIRYYTAALSARGNNAGALLNLGHALQDIDRVHEAIEVFQKAAEIKPDYVAAHYSLGLALADKEDLAGALAKLQKALTLDPNFSPAHDALGKVLSDKKDLRGSIAKHKKAIAIDKSNPIYHHNLVKALVDNEDLDGAFEACNEAFLIHRNHPALLYAMGKILHAKKKYQAAIAALKKAIEIVPYFVNAHNDLGLVYHDEGDWDKAIIAYKKAIAINPHSATSRYNLGRSLLAKNDLSGAIAEYRKALVIDPSLAQGYNNLGHALHLKNDLNGAIAAYREAIRCDVNDVVAHTNLAFALLANGDAKEAIKECNTAITIDRNHAPAYLHLGLALYEDRDYPGAIAAYRGAIRIDPKYAKAYNNLGNALLLTKGDLNGAIDAYKHAIKLKPYDSYYYRTLALALTRKGDFEGAIAVLKTAISKDPGNGRNHYALGNLHSKGDLAKAISAFRTAIALNPQDAEAHCNLGHALRKQGKFAAAVESLRRGHQLGSRQIRWRYPSAEWVKQCERLAQMEQRFQCVLKGKIHVEDSRQKLELAYFCLQYKKRYQFSFRFFKSAFADLPILATDILKFHRYNAACAAVLAAKAKNANTISDKEKYTLRRQAFDWLQADLRAWNKHLHVEPISAMMMQKKLNHWQEDPDLIIVRDSNELSKLSKEEKEDWKKLWSEVVELRKKARGSYTETVFKGSLTTKQGVQNHTIKMTSGKIYVIDMQSNQFDTVLRLEDAKGNKLAENDDIDYTSKNLNSRIVFAPKQNDIYRLSATSYQQKSKGAYEIIIREFVGTK